MRKFSNDNGVTVTAGKEDKYGEVPIKISNGKEFFILYSIADEVDYDMKDYYDDIAGNNLTYDKVKSEYLSSSKNTLKVLLTSKPPAIELKDGSKKSEFRFSKLKSAKDMVNYIKTRGLTYNDSISVINNYFDEFPKERG